VDLALSPRERWSAALHDFLALRGVAPFLDFYTAVLDEMKLADADVFSFYSENLLAFEKAYAELHADALGEMRALAEALQAHCRGEECPLLSWPRVFLAQLHMQIQNVGPKLGECTSVVVRQPNGSIVHVRNWDFGPSPDALGSASTTVDFTGMDGSRFTCLLALTHITKWTTCLRPGAFSLSLNARGFGEGHERGRSPAEELRLLQLGRLPRTEVLRRVMVEPTFGAALAAAAASRPLTSMYIILADGAPPSGSSSGSMGGAVVTLEGDGRSSDVWPMPLRGETEDDWFLVQTNVDHWLRMAQNATSSHRREHVRARLRALGPEAAASGTLLEMLQDKEVYPKGNEGPDDGRIFRPSTIASVVMRPSDGTFEPFLWRALPQRPAGMPAPSVSARGPVLRAMYM